MTESSSKAALNPKQRRFVEEYLLDANATQAAVRAGYSAKTAHAQGHQLLKNPKVAGALTAARNAQADRLDMTAHDVLRGIARLAQADVRKLFDEEGRLRPIRELDDDVAAAVTSIEVATKTAPGGEPGAVKYIHKIRLADKNLAWANLARHLVERKGRPIRFALPPIGTASDISTAIGALAEAMSRGELTPDEGATIASVLEVKRKAVETTEIERRIAALEEKSLARN